MQAVSGKTLNFVGNLSGKREVERGWFLVITYGEV